MIPNTQTFRISQWRCEVMSCSSPLGLHEGFMKHWPFQIKDKSGKPIIEVKHKGEDREFVSRVDFRMHFPW